MIIFLSKKGIGESKFASISVFHLYFMLKPNHTFVPYTICTTFWDLPFLASWSQGAAPNQLFQYQFPCPCHHLHPKRLCQTSSQLTDGHGTLRTTQFLHFLLSDGAEMTSYKRQHTWTHTSNHYSISSIDDLIDVIDALLILNLPEVSDHPICWYHPMPPMD